MISFGQMPEAKLTVKYTRCFNNGILYCPDLKEALI